VNVCIDRLEFLNLFFFLYCSSNFLSILILTCMLCSYGQSYRSSFQFCSYLISYDANDFNSTTFQKSFSNAVLTSILYLFPKQQLKDVFDMTIRPHCCNPFLYLYFWLPVHEHMLHTSTYIATEIKLLCFLKAKKVKYIHKERYTVDFLKRNSYQLLHIREINSSNLI
jgi:hypothetical protein